MRVVMNGLAALKPKTGVGHYVAQLHRHLTDLFPNDPVTLYPGQAVGGVIRRGWRVKSSAGGGPASQPGGWAATARRMVGAGLAVGKEAAKAASRLYFAGYSRALPFDLYHEPNFVPYRCPRPTVVTVHDLSVLLHPDWHPADRVRFHDRHFLDGLARAEHVVVVSEAVRREVVGDLGYPADRVTAVHNGVSPSFRPQPDGVIAAVRSRLGLPERYLLCVGAIEPRKNLLTALRAFADLRPAVREACPLVLVGPWGWRADAEREFLARVGVPSGVRHLGYVPDGDLPALYGGAAALLYPSRYEGFGLPPVEMLACGGAVVSSTAAAMREVLGSHAVFLDPDDVPGWRRVMDRVATDREYGTSLRAGGAAFARRYSWAETARRTFDIYCRILGLPVPSVGGLTRAA